LTAKKGTYQGKLLSTNNQFQSSKKKGAKILGKKKKKGRQYPGKKKSMKQSKEKNARVKLKFFYLVSLSSSV
jgi:hypothetical protein